MAAAAAAAVATVASLRRRIASMKETAQQNMETNIENASVFLQNGDIDNPTVYSKTCMKLGSSIDSAIAMNAFPSSFHLSQLLLVVKEVYRRKTEILQPSLMLLMLPIKAACQIGWFQDVDKDGLLIIANEVGYGFSNTDKMNIEPNNAHSSVSNIVSRFYPTMKVEHILTSLDVEAGYGTFVADFHISLGTTPRQCRNLWLLAAQLDNMETSACITNPLNVDFLINGCGVPNRTKINMGKGPQLPSNVTKMTKYGVNLLQVFGFFDGPYIIALAFMNSISSTDPSELQDYLRPMSDCAINETSSRITLYCPLSQRRIKTPVKGHLCKHYQCFDYNHFIEVNSTEPTWKCPLCNNPVCNQDLRVDRDFQKILNEVAEDVHDVIISEDGSWTAADTKRDTTNHSTVTTPAVSVGQTQVKLCTTEKAQSTSYLGQIQVNVYTTNQAQSMTKLTPPATVTMPAVSPGEPQIDVCTTEKTQSTTMLTPTTTSLGQTQVNACTENHMFTPPAAVTKPAMSSGQPQVNMRTTTHAQSKTTVFTPPADVTKPAVSPGQPQVNVCTTTQAQSTTTMLTPPSSKLAPNVSQVSPCELLEASGDAMPSGRMRGSLRGDRLQAARLQYLAPPQQPARANEPWFRPPIPSLPMPFLTPKTPNNSDNV